LEEQLQQALAQKDRDLTELTVAKLAQEDEHLKKCIAEKDGVLAEQLMQREEECVRLENEKKRQAEQFNLERIRVDETKVNTITRWYNFFFGCCCIHIHIRF
jgi:hypothetical protein